MKTTPLCPCFSTGKAFPKAPQIRFLYPKTLLTLITSLFIWSTGNLAAQEIGDYQSAQSGDWNTLSTWEIWDGDTWLTPTDLQGPPDADDGIITILATHIVTIATDVTADEITIEVDGQVSVSDGSTWTIPNDPDGTDLTVNGTLENLGTITGLESTGICQVEVNGTVINQNGAVFNTTFMAWTYNSGGTYTHARNGSTVPTATWNAASNCEITGIGNTEPGNLGQTFGNFIWNCPDMGQTADFGETGLDIAGSLEVLSTGSRYLQIVLDQLNIGGNLILVSGAEIRLSSGSIARTVNVAGGFRMTGGALRLTTSGAGGSLNIAGDFDHSGGFIYQGGGGTANINFNGTEVQTFFGGGAYSAAVNFNILAGSTVSFNPADLSGSAGTLTNNGTLMGNTTESNPLSLPEGGLVNTVDGTIAPGNSVGTLTIIGDLLSVGTLFMEIESLTVFDRIIVTGTATINGDLIASFGTYVPIVGNTFQLISATFYAGALANPVTTQSTGSSITATYDDASGILEITTVLPIELVSFSGKRVDEQIELNWRTASEQNNDYMAVERAGHDLNFREIGRVQGAGTTTEIQHYQFFDTAPMEGANYYRLRQVDIDGAVTYHHVIYVDFIDPSRVSRLQVYPNPAQDIIRASWGAGTEQSATIRLFTESGQLISTYQVNAKNGTMELPLDRYPAGKYILQLIRGYNFENIPFVKH